MTDTLDDILERSRRLGFLGPGSVRVHRRHAAGFAHGIPAPDRFLDLGSGGGVPGLVLALLWPQSTGVLLDARERRCAFLQEAVRALGIHERVRVVRGRAEEVGRHPELRAGFDVVVARSFGPPAVTAECGAPFLRVGGHLVVSEPPGENVADGSGEHTMRWPAEGLAVLGLAPDRTWHEPYHYRSLVQERLCPDRYPRRVGVPAKRPLF